MALYAYMVTYNEADRYLEGALKSLSDLVDGLLVYDDRSTDDSVNIARQYADVVTVRGLNTPGFLDDEAAFRQQAWDALNTSFRLSETDWILTLDADEFLYPEERERIDTVITSDVTYDGIWMKVREVFAFTDQPMVRVDGFWNDIHALRLVRWSPHATFAPRKMGSGSVPVLNNGFYVSTNELEIIHYGYLHPSDREEKYQRYRGRPGHNPKHINSILLEPALVPIDVISLREVDT